MRTKKAEIASQKQIDAVEPVTVSVAGSVTVSSKQISSGKILYDSVADDDVPQVKEYRVFVRFSNRENAENFKFKLKSLGYDNVELSEV